MGIDSKAKGNRGELELVKIFEKKFGKGKFKRSPQSGAHVGGLNRELNENLSIEAKITLVSDIITPIDFAFVIEHKFYNKASFWDLFNEKSELNKWLEQVEGDAKFVNKKPMLVVKYNRKPRIAYVRLDDRSYVFEYRNWFCYLLEELLKRDNNFWFE